MTASVCAAAVCAGAAAWLTADRGRTLRRAEERYAVAGVCECPARRGSPGRAAAVGVGREWICLPVAALLAVLGESVLPLIVGAAAVPLVARWLRAVEKNRARERRTRGVVALCGTAAGELRAGLQPVQA